MSKTVQNYFVARTLDGEYITTDWSAKSPYSLTISFEDADKFESKSSAVYRIYEFFEKNPDSSAIFTIVKTCYLN
jgi:dynactin complex subunit